MQIQTGSRIGVGSVARLPKSYHGILSKVHILFVLVTVILKWHQRRTNSWTRSLVLAHCGHPGGLTMHSSNLEWINTDCNPTTLENNCLDLAGSLITHLGSGINVQTSSIAASASGDGFIVMDFLVCTQCPVLKPQITSNHPWLELVFPVCEEEWCMLTV